MPRPLKMLNASNIRTCIPDRFLARGTEIPPSASLPWV